MKKVFKKVINLGIVCIICIMCSGVFSGCEARRNFTEEEHVERITERVQERFFSEGSEFADIYTGFKVEILYNFWDEPEFFMVEFEPDGFLYGTIRRNEYYFSLANFYRGSIWEEKFKETPWRGQRPFWEQELGPYFDKVRHYRSHFFVEGIIDEKKYLHWDRLGELNPYIKKYDTFNNIYRGGGWAGPSRRSNPPRHWHGDRL